MSPRQPRPPKLRGRPRQVSTLAPETIDALTRLTNATGESRGRILDAAVTHAHRCRCVICLEIAHEKASER